MTIQTIETQELVHVTGGNRLNTPVAPGAMRSNLPAAPTPFRGPAPLAAPAPAARTPPGGLSVNVSDLKNAFDGRGATPDAAAFMRALGYSVP